MKLVELFEQNLNEAPIAYHGSPYYFDEFTLDHIGKGEGSLRFGWGLYFTKCKDHAEYYAKIPNTNDSAAAQKVYVVQIPDENVLLNWYSDWWGQTNYVRNILKNSNLLDDQGLRNSDGTKYHRTGQDVYNALKRSLGNSSEQASKYLHGLGIEGNIAEHKDMTGNRTHKDIYVIFNNAAIKILNKMGT